MFRPNTFCFVKERTGFDAWGKETHGNRRRVRCSVVRLKSSRVKTSVRADSSASRGRGQEIESDSILLLPPSVEIKTGDLIEIMGLTLEVVGIEIRLNIMGRHDHNEVSLNAWASK